MAKNNWLEEAKASRRILIQQWEAEGKPLGDFYKWLIEKVDNRLLIEMDKNFRETVK